MKGSGSADVGNSLTDLSEVLDLVVLEQLPEGFVQITAGSLPS